jgi:hypothetical protein
MKVSRHEIIFITEKLPPKLPAEVFKKGFDTGQISIPLN